MITISVRDDFKRGERMMNDLERRQLPFALARALNATAKAGQADTTRELPRAFDKPTPFTQRGIGIKTAARGELEAEVFVRPIQAEYLALQERGGVREPKGQALVTPVAVRVNQYGNIPNKALRRAKARKQVFVGQVRGTGGFWERTKDGLKLLARFDGPKRVKRNEWFMPTVTATVRREFPRQFPLAMREALRTARR
jgi:hypothetical protein